MRKITLAVLTLVSMLGICANAWAGAQDFTLTNEIGQPIHKVFVSEVSTSEWEEDILGKDVLMSGDSVDITFAADADGAHYDLKAVDGDGNEYIWGDLNLYETTGVTIKLQNGKPVAYTDGLE